MKDNELEHIDITPSERIKIETKNRILSVQRGSCIPVGDRNVGIIVKELCREKQITPMELERYCDLSNSSVARWSTGSSPNVRQIIKVAEYFNVSVDYLIGRTAVRDTVDDLMLKYNRKQMEHDSTILSIMGSLKLIFADINIELLSMHDIAKLKKLVELILDK